MLAEGSELPPRPAGNAAGFRRPKKGF